MIAGQFIRFILTGGTSLAVDLAALHLLIGAGLAQFIAVAVAFLIGVAVNLLMHKFFTFRETSRLHAAQLARYLAVVALNLAVTEAIFWFATASLGLAPIAAKLLSLPPVLLIGFSLSRAWVFVPPAGRA